MKKFPGLCEDEAWDDGSMRKDSNVDTTSLVAEGRPDLSSVRNLTDQPASSAAIVTLAVYISLRHGLGAGKISFSNLLPSGAFKPDHLVATCDLVR